MKAKRPPRRVVVELVLTPIWALRRIRALAAKSENVRFTNHALDQMERREIFDGDILRIYRSEASQIKGEVTRGKNDGEYHCKVVRKIRGAREVGVATIILPNDQTSSVDRGMGGFLMTRAYAHVGEVIRDQPLRYTGCGLDDVYLRSGYEIHPDNGYGESVSVKDVDDLRRVIGEQLIRKKKFLKGKELRFLRTGMDLTQSELGRLIGYSDQQVARWEKDQSRIPAPANKMIRLLFREHLGSHDLSIREVLDHLDRLDNTISERQVFEKAGKTWRISVG